MINFTINNIINIKSQCIVNSTNKYLEWEETTVNGDIQNKGGKELQSKLKEIINIKKELSVSEPIITKGYNLDCDYIIHVFPPHWILNNNIKYSDSKLIETYKNCLNIAIENNINQICFPVISSGTFGYPIDRSCLLSFYSCLLFQLYNQIDIAFCLYNKEIYEIAISIYNLMIKDNYYLIKDFLLKELYE